MRFTLLTMLIASALLTGCGSTPPRPDPISTLSLMDVADIKDTEQLEVLYKTLTVGLRGKNEADYASDFAIKSLVEKQLLAIERDRVEEELNQLRIGGDSPLAKLIPLSALLRLKDHVDSSEFAGIPEWDTLTQPVKAEYELSRSLANKLEAKVSKGNLKVEQQVDIYNQLYSLTGEHKWAVQRDTELESVLSDIRTADSKQNYDESLESKIDLVRAVHSDNPALLDEMMNFDAKIYTKRFFDALASGSADAAYDILVSLSQVPEFPKIKDKIKPSSQKMADYFSALADESLERPENLSQSYRWYSKAQQVRSILGLPPTAKEKSEVLVKQLDRKYRELKKQNENGAALALLYAIEEFQPYWPELRKSISQLESVVRDSAVKRLGPASFQSRANQQDFADLISAFVTQFLMEKLPADVQVVDREHSKTASSLDLLLVGNVLEAKVETSETRNKKLMRVSVGDETVQNPAFVTWLQMPAKERTTVDKPSETIVVNKRQNITVGVTRHRKAGIFSVSYRLVEASTGKVVLPDTLTLQSEFDGESSEGVEMGSYVVPFKLASLPSDAEVLNGLARKVAAEISKKLVVALSSQDETYLASANTFAAQKNCSGEVNSLVKAVLIAKLKSKDSTQLLARLRNQSVACY